MRLDHILPAAFLVFAISIASAHRAVIASTWTGASSANWSDPGNWIGGVPNGGAATVTLPIGTTPGHINQNIVAGVTVSQITSNQGGLSGSKFLIDGNAISLGGGGTISYSSSTPSSSIPLVVQAPVQLLGAATLTSAGAFNSNNGLYGNLIYDLGGAGSVISTGVGSGAADSVILRPAYTGTTTVRSGMFRVGGAVVTTPGTYQYFQANSSNQGDYTIMSGATLTGMGTIGLASGGRVTLAGGKLVPGAGDFLGLGEDGGIGRSMHINGDLVVGDGATCGANFLSPGSTIIDVNAARPARRRRSTGHVRPDQPRAGGFLHRDGVREPPGQF